MTDHEQFKKLLIELSISYQDLADQLGITKNSVKSLLSPSRNFPSWAKSMLYTRKLLGSTKIKSTTPDKSESSDYTNPNQLFLLDEIEKLASEANLNSLET